MRIKKTSQYIEGGANLSNVYGTSNENGYTQEYINNLTTKAYKEVISYAAISCSGNSTTTILSTEITTTGKPLVVMFEFVANTTVDNAQIIVKVGNTSKRLGSLFAADGRMHYCYATIIDNLEAGTYTAQGNIYGETANFATTLPNWTFKRMQLFEI